MDFPKFSSFLLLTVAGGGPAKAAIVCFFFITFSWIWLLQVKRSFNGRLPPGPYSWPIVGNLHQLSVPVHRTLKDVADRYGPLVFLRLGSVPTVVVSSSEMASHFLKTHDLIFASRPLTAAGKYMFYDYKDVVFAPYGDHWRQMRKICVLQLLTAKRIESFKHVREEEVSEMIRSIWEESERGRMVVNVSKAISTLTSNIVWLILVKKKFSDDQLGGDFKGFKDLLLEMTATLGAFYIGDFIPFLDWLDLQWIKQRMKKSHKTFNGFAEKIIEEHVNQRMAADSNVQKESEHCVEDFVDVLLNMAESNTEITRETIKALVLNMFGAGLDTTSTTLEWAMSELLRNPHVMKRLQEEIESVVSKHRQVNESDLATMKYLHCVVRETLRLYPAVPLAIPHESVEAVTVGGYYIPKKTTVMLNVWAIGRDPIVWGPDASKFKPERFMEDKHLNLTGQSDFSMIPFGAGRRGCPGAAMAIPTIELALAQLFHSFEWRIDGDPSELDMKEAHGLSIPREVPLYAYPSLRVSFPPLTGDGA